MKCPYCGADNENKTSYCGSCGSYIKMPEQQPNTVVNQNIYINNKTEVAPSYSTYDSYSPSETASKGVMRNKVVILWLIFFYPIGLILMWFKTHWNIIIKCVISVLCLILTIGIIVGMVEEEKRIDEFENTPWALNPAQIEDFDYYIDNNQIYLGKYKGADMRVLINSEYQISGKTMKVVELHDNTFSSTSIRSVIIPEGVTTLNDRTFYGSNITLLFLPSTLVEVDSMMWSDFEDTKKIYFGGTEEQWKKLCTVERAELDVQEIICNAKIEDLK